MKIICIGRNYATHAAELNNPVPTKPVVFLKPETALQKDPAVFYLPEHSHNVHYECELVVRICKTGKFIEPEFAAHYWDAFSLGIDFTARDVQDECKAKGLPWEVAKAFDGSAPVGRFLPKSMWEISHPPVFHLLVNGIERQTGNPLHMLFTIEQIIAYASRLFTLKTGDLIFTGTPEGVGQVHAGDRLQAVVCGEALLTCEVR